MGSIPQYQRDQFASSYVGGAQKDESNALVAGALQEELVEPVRKNEIAKLKEREDALTDMSANAKIIDATWALQQQLHEAQTRFADNPMAYPDEAKRISGKIAETYAEGIGDERIKTKFMKAMGSVQRAAVAPAFEYAYSQQEAKAVIDTQDALDQTTLLAGDSPNIDNFKANVSTMSSTMKLAETSIDIKTRNKMMETALRAATDRYMANQIEVNPLQMAKDLDTGKYDNIEIPVEVDAEGNVTKSTRLPLTAAKKTEYAKLARDYAAKKQADRDLQTVIRSTGVAFESASEFFGNKIGITELIRRRDVMDRTEGVPQAAKDDMDATIRVARSIKENTANLDDGALMQTYAEWSDLQKTINQNKRTKGKKKGELKSPEKLTTELLEFSTRLKNRVDQGLIERKVAAKINSELAGPLYASVTTQTGQSGWFGYKADPNADYYRALNAKVDTMNVAGADKVVAKNMAFGLYMDKVIRAKDKGVAVSGEDHQKFAREAYTETVNYFHPNASATMTDEAVNATANEKNGVTPVHKSPTNVKTTAKVVPPKPVDGTIRVRSDGKWKWSKAEDKWLPI